MPPQIFGLAVYHNLTVFNAAGGKKALKKACLCRDYAVMAAMPGSTLPSKYSSIAPPPVDT
jgi:hypothetical protein